MKGKHVGVLPPQLRSSLHIAKHKNNNNNKVHKNTKTTYALSINAFTSTSMLRPKGV